jgi:hypothetical protein
MTNRKIVMKMTTIALMLEAVKASETAKISKITWCNVTEGRYSHGRWRKNLKSLLLKLKLLREAGTLW